MKELRNLIDVRSIISLSASSVFVYLSIKGVFQPETIMNVILIVFSFYLGRETYKNKEYSPDQEMESEKDV